MVKGRDAQLDAVFAALAHPIRRAMLERLAEGDCAVGDLAKPHDVSLPAISKHLRILEDAGLLTQTPDGRVRRCSLAPKPLSAAFSWIVQYRILWEERLDALARHLQGENPR
ncbi:MAG TPA: metalloregulator ArsR/SmtB family transcription factor [Candidatus Thermoplasmatota archaeon]|nr:metalloregulator ArsR/SmtB family transcription factor [Candidatus Thermoplasmatota archaeon]